MPANLTLSDFNNAFFDPAQNGSVAHVQKPSDDAKTKTIHFALFDLTHLNFQDEPKTTLFL